MTFAIVSARLVDSLSLPVPIFFMDMLLILSMESTIQWYDVLVFFVFVLYCVDEVERWMYKIKVIGP